MITVNLGKIVGKSAYESAVENGFTGTEIQWLATLKGDIGPEGPGSTLDSAELIALKQKVAQKEISVWDFVHLIPERTTNLDHNTWDWTPAILAAIASVVTARNTQNNYFINSKILFPSGRYRHRGFVLKPFIRVKTSGFVEFSYFGPVESPSIKILGSDSETPYYKNFYTRGSILDGSNGAIALINEHTISNTVAGRNRASIGLEIEHTANYAINDIAITGFGVGIMLVATHHWLGRFNRMHLEENTYHLVWGKTKGQESVNSGENFTFTDCNMNGAEAAVLIQSDTPDFSFYGSSLNFNKNVVLIQAGHGYTCMKFTDCYIEENGQEFFRNEVDPNTMGWYQTPSFYCNNLSVLAHPGIFFKGHINVYVQNFEIRLYYAPNSLDNLFMTDITGELALSNVHYVGYGMLQDINGNLNPNTYNSLAVGANALTGEVPFLSTTVYEEMVEYITSAKVSNEVLFNNKKTLKITGSNANSRFKSGFAPGKRMTVSPGDKISAKAIIALNSTTDIGLQWQLVAYDASGNRLTAITEQAWWSYGLAADTTKKLQVIGTDKYITCPVGTAYVDVYFLMGGLLGDAYLADIFLYLTGKTTPSQPEVNVPPVGGVIPPVVVDPPVVTPSVNINPNKFNSVVTGATAITNNVLVNASAIPFLTFTHYEQMIENITNVSISETVKYNGLKTLKIDGSGSSRLKMGYTAANRVPAVAGDQFKASLTGASNSATVVGTQWQFAAYDISGNRLTALTEQAWWSYGFNIDNTAQFSTLETVKFITCPVGTAYVDMYLIVGGITGSFYLADIFIEKTGTTTPPQAEVLVPPPVVVVPPVVVDPPVVVPPVPVNINPNKFNSLATGATAITNNVVNTAAIPFLTFSHYEQMIERITSVSISEEMKYNGSKTLKIVGGENGTPGRVKMGYTAANRIPAVAGEKFTASITGAVSVGSVAGPQWQFAAYDVNGNRLTALTEAGWWSYDFSSGSPGQFVTLETQKYITCPIGTAYVDMYVLIGITGTFYLADLFIEKTGTTTPPQAEVLVPPPVVVVPPVVVDPPVVVPPVAVNINPNKFNSLATGSTAIAGGDLISTTAIPFLTFTHYGQMIENITNVAISETVKYNGLNTLKIDGVAGSRLKMGYTAANRVPAVAGDQFKASLTGASNSNTAVGTQWQFVAYDASGNQLTAINEQAWWSYGFLADTTVQFVTLETQKYITCPTGTAYVDMYLIVGGITGTFYLADLFIEKT